MRNYYVVSFKKLRQSFVMVFMSCDKIKMIGKINVIMSGQLFDKLSAHANKHGRNAVMQFNAVIQHRNSVNSVML